VITWIIVSLIRTKSFDECRTRKADRREAEQFTNGPPTRAIYLAEAKYSRRLKLETEIRSESINVEKIGIGDMKKLDQPCENDQIGDCIE
jgi:hypothetical protein